MDRLKKIDPRAHDIIQTDSPATHKTMSVMLNRDVCNHEDLPCDRPNGKSFRAEGPWRGLASLDIWWRPARSEIQKEQDKVIRSFMRACKIGYRGDFVEFARAYRGGLGAIDPSVQDKIVYSFLAAAHFEKGGNRPTLANHVLCYIKGLTEAQLKYETLIDQWLDHKEQPKAKPSFWVFIGGHVDRVDPNSWK